MVLKISKNCYSHFNYNHPIFPLQLPIYFNYERKRKYIKPGKGYDTMCSI